MNRREFLQCTAILFSGATAAQLGFALNSEQRTFLANAPDYSNQKLTYLTPEQRSTLAAMTEIIIPRTETPGAIDAGVARYIELMVQQWMNGQERQIFDKGLAQLMNSVQEKFDKPFEQLDAKTQLAIMEDMEEEASASNWYDMGNTMRDFVNDAPFICQVKELTIWGFFTSEVGGTQVLRFNPMPMTFESDIPLQPEDGSWSMKMM